MVDIAQPVEHLIVVQKVARSSRVIHPTWAMFKLLTKETILGPV